jgi:hypothetical protein
VRDPDGRSRRRPRARRGLGNGDGIEGPPEATPFTYGIASWQGSARTRSGRVSSSRSGRVRSPCTPASRTPSMRSPSSCSP